MYQPTLDELAEELSSTAEWRRQKAEEHPDDARNIKSAEHIENLCDQLRCLGKCREYSELLDVYSVMSEDSDKLSAQIEAENDYRSGIGFRSIPTDARSYLSELAGLCRVRTALKQ